MTRAASNAMRFATHVASSVFALFAADAGAADDLVFDTIGTGAGLPYPNVTSIVQDAQGYMWFGTGAGLARYDGYRFRVYGNDAADAKTLADAYIRTLSVDRDGNLWVGTMAGLERYLRDTDSWRHFSLDDARTSAQERKMVWQIMDNPECRGAGHRLWLGTSDGLKQLDYDTGQVTTIRNDAKDPGSLAADRVYALASDAQCRIWVGTSKGVQYLARDATRFSAFPPAPDPSIKPARVEALLVDESQTLWIGTKTDRSAWDISGPELVQPRRWFQQAATGEEAAQHIGEDHRHRI